MNDHKKNNMWARFRNDVSATSLVGFALMLPVLLTVSVGGFDYAWAVMQKSALQEAADTAAIAGGKELSLSDSRRENVEAVVRAMVQRSIADNSRALVKKTQQKPTVDAKVTDDPLQVTVVIKQPIGAVVGGLFGLEFPPIEITSVARVVGQPNICVLALDSGANKAISLEHDARVTGRNCAVYSNSAHKNAVIAKNSATLTASFICSRGGKSGGSGNFNPTPMTDCPGFDDPLAGRPEPLIGPCTENDYVVEGVVAVLQPGTYCGGLRLESGTEAEMLPGVYVFKDGPLVVEDGATLTGKGVGLFYTGRDAYFLFEEKTTISLEAPVSGPMAGLLMFEGRAQDTSARHEFLSNNAPVVLGTLYLSRGELHVDADTPIAQDSAYTAIVARVMRLYGGPHLILNTDYDKTNVPVPKGIRGAGQPVSLVQ